MPFRTFFVDPCDQRTVDSHFIHASFLRRILYILFENMVLDVVRGSLRPSIELCPQQRCRHIVGKAFVTGPTKELAK